MKWFDRKFDFSGEQNIFPGILERLEGTPIRLSGKLKSLSKKQRTQTISGGWSIQEHLGHLLDLEPLWQKRLEDILLQKDYLSPADLENRKTHNADHNDAKMEDLLEQFRTLRLETLEHLHNLTEIEIYKTALHPRLNQPMRTMDLFFFVAEHDDHHLARISELIRSTAQIKS